MRKSKANRDQSYRDAAKSAPPVRLSKMLWQLHKETEEKISLGDVSAALQKRSLGASMLIFSIPCILPLPPFTTMVLGLPLILISWQMALGKQTISLPNFITRRYVSAERGKAIIEKSVPIVERIERAVKPRFWTLMREPTIARIVAAFMLVVSLVVVLPIPFGNWLPAFGCAFYGAALTQRDGVVLILSLLISTASLIIAGAVLWFGVEFIQLLKTPFLALF